LFNIIVSDIDSEMQIFFHFTAVSLICLLLRWD